MYFLGPDETASLSYALIGLCLCFEYVIVSTLIIGRQEKRRRRWVKDEQPTG